MKKILFFISFILVFVNCNVIIFAQENNKVKIGLEYKYKNISSLTVNNNTLNVGFGDNYDYKACGKVDFDDNVIVKVSDKYYLRVNDNFTSYKKALKKADSIDNSIIAIEDEGVWAIYIGGYNTESKAEETKDKLGIDTKIVSSFDSSISLYSNSKQAIVLNNQKYLPQIYSDTEITTLNDRSYRGKIEFKRNNNTFNVINVISIEEYLYSVVPSEMPASWPKEALKAQAVACRNYAFSQIKASKHVDYDLCDSTHCQAYKGSQNESQNSTSAVKTTIGLLAYYNGEIINAVYHSSSGGYTEDAEKIWNDATPYLRGVKEINETEYKNWSRTFTLTELTGLLSKNGSNIGNAKNVVIKSAVPTGRVSNLTIVGTSGTKVLEKENIRTFFSSSSNGSLESRNFTIANGVSSKTTETVKNTSTSNSKKTIDTKVVVTSIDSKENLTLKGLNVINSDEDITKINSKVLAKGSNQQKEYDLKSSENEIVDTNQTVEVITSTGNSVTFIGKGWGHGAGMSQYGAKGMAEKGYTYDEILKHYYTDIKLY